MRVVFVTLPCRGLRVGGVANKIAYTRQALMRKGVDVVLYNPWEDFLRDVDVCHIFQAHDSLYLTSLAAYNRKVPLVISPIFNATNWLVQRLVSSVATRIPGVGVSLRLRKRMMQMASALLPLSEQEKRITLKSLSGLDPAKMHIVPNGVEARFASASPDPFVQQYGFRPDVLFVGRIDRNKNLLSLLEAVRGSGLQVAVVGSAEGVDSDYHAQCVKTGQGFATFIGRLDHKGEMLASAYAASRVFVLPSHMEVFPNTVLEAGLAGCRIVLTKNTAMGDVLGQRADYIDPGQIGDIRKKVLDAHAREPSTELKDLLLRDYTWDNIAGLILDIYKTVLAKPATPAKEPSRPVDHADARTSDAEVRQ